MGGVMRQPKRTREIKELEAQERPSEFTKWLAEVLNNLQFNDIQETESYTYCLER
jgi:hypothetical protein